MDLTYWVWVVSSPDQGKFSVDLVFTDGSRMSTSQDAWGHPIFDSTNRICYASHQGIPYGQWVGVTCDLSELRDKTIQNFEFVYDDGSGGHSGGFSAYFGGVRLISAGYPEGIVNVGFESGLSGWDSTGTSAPSLMGAKGQQYGSLYGAFDGTQAAVLGPNPVSGECALSASWSDIAQPFIVPNAGTGGTDVELSFEVTAGLVTQGPSDTTCSSTYSYASVYLDDRTTQSTIMLIPNVYSVMSPCQCWSWAGESFDLTNMGLGGHIVWLHFHNVNSAGGAWSQLGVDDVMLAGPFAGSAYQITYSENFQNGNDGYLDIPFSYYSSPTFSGATQVGLYSDFGVNTKGSSNIALPDGVAPGIPLATTLSISPTSWNFNPQGSTVSDLEFTVSVGAQGNSGWDNSNHNWEYVAVPWLVCLTVGYQFVSGNPFSTNPLSLTNQLSGMNLTPSGLIPSGVDPSSLITNALSGLSFGLDSVSIMSDALDALDLGLAMTPGVGTALDVVAVAADLLQFMLASTGTPSTCSGVNTQQWYAPNSVTNMFNTYSSAVSLLPLVPAVASIGSNTMLIGFGSKANCGGGAVYDLNFGLSVKYYVVALQPSTQSVDVEFTAPVTSSYTLQVTTT